MTQEQEARRGFSVVCRNAMILCGVAAALWFATVLSSPAAGLFFWRKPAPEVRIPALVRKLSAPAWRVRDDAEAELTVIADTHLDLVLDAGLHALLTTEDPEVRMRAERMLESLVLAHLCHAEQGFLGVTLSHQLFTETVDQGKRYGINMVSIFEGSAAEKYGLVAGMKIMRIDDHVCGPRFGVKELVTYISSKRPGVTIQLLLQKDGDSNLHKLELGARPWFPTDTPPAQRRKEFLDQWFEQNMKRAAEALNRRAAEGR